MSEVQQAEVQEITAMTVLADLKKAAGKLEKQEAKAKEADSAAAKFNDDIIAMASGEIAQTAERNVATLAKDQAKHIKRAAALRAKNADTVLEVRTLRSQMNEFLDDLLLAYGEDTPVEDVAEDVEEDEVFAEEEA